MEPTKSTPTGFPWIGLSACLICVCFYCMVFYDSRHPTHAPGLILDDPAWQRILAVGLVGEVFSFCGSFSKHKWNRSLSVLAFICIGFIFGTTGLVALLQWGWKAMGGGGITPFM